MKAVINEKINQVMKNYTKYICAILLLLGTSVSAWGAASISGSIDSKTINVDDDHAEGYFTFTVSSTNVEADPSGKYLNVYVDAPNTDGSTYYWDCGFGTTEEEVGDGYFQCSSTSGTVGVYYWFNAEGDYSFTVTVWGYEDAGSYDAIYYEVPVTVKVHKSCTDRTISFANATVTKDFGTTAAKFQDYTLSNSGGTVTWSSDDPTIASVNSSTGVVTINRSGSTYINVEVANNGTYCKVEDLYELTVYAVTPTLSSTATDKELTVSGITSTSAYLTGGVVLTKGDASLTQYGFIVGTTSDVVMATEGRKAGGWNSDIAVNTAFGTKQVINLNPNTTYYVRPFAYNGSYYGYGPAVSFTTLQRYAVTYYKNDGGDDSAVEYKDHGVNYTVSSDKFSRSGYTLSKWHTLAAGSGGTDYAVQSPSSAAVPES